MKAPSQAKSKIIILLGFVLLILVAVAMLIIGQRINQPSTTAPISQSDPEFSPDDNSSYSEILLLQEKARALLKNEVPDLAKQQKISIEQIVALERKMKQADQYWQEGQHQQAQTLYQEVLHEVQSQGQEQKLWQEIENAEAKLLQILAALEPVKSVIAKDYQLALKKSDEGQWAKKQKQWPRALQSMEEGLQALAPYPDIHTVLSTLASTIEADYQKLAVAKAQEQLALLQQAAPDPSAYTPLANKVSQLPQLHKLWQEAQRQHQASNLKLALQFLTQMLAIDESLAIALDAQKVWQEELLMVEASGFYEKGLAAFKQNELTRAQEYNNNALSIYPQHPQALQLRQKIAETRKQLAIKEKLDKAYQYYQTKEYAKAKVLYQEILKLEPQQAEAKTGLETTSLLLSAQTKFNASFASAQKLAQEGRYPIAIQYFNKALASKPTSLELTAEQTAFEKELLRQSKKISVTITSDNKSYVSIIGVLPPTRLKKKTLSLYPDVYKVTATRKNYYDEQDTFKVAVDNENTLSIRCQNKR